MFVRLVNEARATRNMGCGTKTQRIMAGLTVDWEIGDLTLKSITGNLNGLLCINAVVAGKSRSYGVELFYNW